MIREGLLAEVSSACNLGSEKDRKEHSRHSREQGQRPRAGSMTGSVERSPGGPGGRRAGPRLPKILPSPGCPRFCLTALSELGLLPPPPPHLPGSTHPTRAGRSHSSCPTLPLTKGRNVGLGQLPTSPFAGLLRRAEETVTQSYRYAINSGSHRPPTYSGGRNRVAAKL